MEEYVLLVDVAKNLNAVSWDILDILSKSEKLSYSDIKDKVNISQNKLTKEMARLEGPLLIKGARDLRDSRVYNYIITDTGKKILKLR